MCRVRLLPTRGGHFALMHLALILILTIILLRSAKIIYVGTSRGGDLLDLALGAPRREALQITQPLRPIDFSALLFITTHVSDSHIDFLRHCWPLALSRSPLLRHADVLVYAAVDGNWTTELEHLLPKVLAGSTGGPGDSMHVRVGRNTTSSSPLLDNNGPRSSRPLTFNYYNNSEAGYQGGAMGAMREAVAQNWFDSYDWIVRVNPDVLIRNDEWLLQTMRNESTDAIFVDCPIEWVKLDDKGKPAIQYGLRKPGDFIHSDFFAVRPRAIPKDAFQPYRLSAGHQVPVQLSAAGGGIKLGAQMLTKRKKKKEPSSAERQMAEVFKNLVKDGRHAWLPHVKHEGWQCRVLGESSPVIHDHDLAERCEKDGSLSGGFVRDEDDGKTY